MGPLIQFILKWLPQILDSMASKDAYAATKGWNRPFHDLFNDPGFQAALEKAALGYERVYREMAAEAPK